MRHQRLTALLTQSAHQVERRGGHPLGPLAAVVADREPVRLVTHPLQQIEPLTVARENHRIRFGRHPHLLEAFRQPDHRDVGDAQLLQHRRRRVDLRGAAVHHEQIGRIGKPARTLVGARIRLRVAHVAQETAAGHLGDRGDIVRASATGRLADRVVPVVRLARQPILEHHQRGHHIGALDVTDVHAFDPQRRLGQPEGVLNALQRFGSRVEVTGTLQLVLGQRLMGIALHGLGQRAFVAAYRDPQAHPRTPQPGQPRRQLIGVRRQHRHQYLTRHRVGGLVGRTAELGLLAVELGQELLHELLLPGLFWIP